MPTCIHSGALCTPPLRMHHRANRMECPPARTSLAVQQLWATGSTDGFALGPWLTLSFHHAGLSWQLGWAAEASSQLALYSPTKIGLWAGLCSLTAATAAFAWTLSQMYGLRRRFLLGPPSFHAFCLYFASTDISTAWLSFSLADKLLVICKAYGAPQQTVDALAMVVIVAAWAGAMWVVSNKKSSYYGLAIIWILVGIYSRQTSQATRAMCLLLVFGLGLACIFSVMRKRGCGGGRDRGLRQMDVPSLPLTCDEHLERIEST